MPHSNWDSYFLEVARAVSTNSKCLSRQIGALLVRGRNIVCTGYNGPPAGVPHCDQRHMFDGHLYELLKANQVSRANMNQCPRRLLGFQSGQGMHWCPASHAEANLINTAAKLGIQTEGCTVYLSCELMPCKDCLCTLIQAGIDEVVVAALNPYDKTSLFILEHAPITIRKYVTE
jgi:dCMP deaminase